MSMSPVELRKLGLDRRLKTHERGPVDRLIAEVTASYEELWRDRNELRERVERLESQLGTRPSRRRVSRTNMVFALLATLVVAAAAGAVAIASGLWEIDARAPAAAEKSPGPVAVPVAEPGAPIFQPPPRLAAAGTALVLTAARGDCWLQLRSDSARGEILFEGTLARGRSLTFTEERFWIRLGAPDVLDLTLNGQAVRNLPPLTADVVVTDASLRVVSNG